MDKCIYCNSNPASKTEHVFPHSLGGQNLRMDCVCIDCNNYFSQLERELIQKSLIGFIRTVEGVEGYSKNTKRKAQLKYPLVLQYVPEDQMIYEVGVCAELQHYLLPQIFKIDDEFYCQGGSEEEIQQMVMNFTNWKKTNLKVALGLPKNESVNGIELYLDNGSYKTKKIRIDKIKGEIIQVNVSKKYSQNIHFCPRIFLDAKKNLIIRSRKKSDGLAFLKEFLNYCNSDKAQVKVYKPIKPPIESINPIDVSFSFSIEKFSRAIAKIAVNTFAYYYPEYKNDKSLNEVKEYVLGKIQNYPIKVLDKKVDNLDTTRKVHYIYICQINNALLIRVSLFQTLIASVYLKDFTHTSNFVPSIIEVDYKENIQYQLSMEQFIAKNLSETIHV